ncbi:ABC transporter ATP-binding protein [Blastococcus sp. TF02-8]|uniref:ABC transporter ATP-binding protein n=1 Tax=Blastococcus sp. TF02-8 TaxID=2250574 RepID=UPI000DEAB0FC|nr:ABC transporter ATP-binding protein [Blastococcus sp. TF02-8]RBY91965.1 ABC transporter ATP-binding protein [Blastococcus sp. TF02-8]
MTTAQLQASDVSFRYGEEWTVREATFSVESREVVAICGRSGAGKSTLLHVAAGLVAPDSGALTCRGVGYDELSESRRADFRLRNFGLVFQFGDLIPELTLVENVELALRLTGTRKRPARERAMAALDQVGIAHLAAKQSGSVSGGELQRAAIARAVVHEPAVVFADEPTGALDDKNSERVVELLFDVARAQGAAVLLVTHDRQIAAACDRILTIADGQLV